ncbi:hypothetical protein QBC38DRAFT_492484 [Podospora fimiseda]|uniref:Uncharacterized protein n=1 Tax=Podospora fimiseda TaxID=252190 RepID=A0AAN6YR10_9PEZI|nr:hypothetical protein QBC38DRAFT_492484 [Podospora fimiseda]
MPDTNHQEDIDQNLVQDVDKELESQLSAFFRSKTTSQIEKLCSDHETRLLEIFQRQVEAFNKQKATVLVTMSHIAIQHGASNAVQPHIFKDMEPKSFEFLNKHFSNHSEPVSPTAVPPSPALSNTTSSPQRDEQRTSPSESRADINNLSQSSSRRSTAKRTNTQLPPSGTSKKQRLDPKTLATSDITPVQLQQQLPPRPPVTAEATPMTRPSPLSSRRNSQAASIGSGETPWKNRTLLPTEVEGRDHVFSSPKYGPGVWYVIRCSCLNRDGSKSIPICFTESPFSNSVCSPGEHFNSVITCPGHVTKEGKPYTVDEMMYYWGYTGILTLPPTNIFYLGF